MVFVFANPDAPVTEVELLQMGRKLAAMKQLVKFGFVYFTNKGARQRAA